MKSQKQTPIAEPRSTDLGRQSLEGLSDLSKNILGHAVKSELTTDFAESWLGVLLIESSKAVSGTLGKVIISVIFKQFDRTTRRLRSLEQRFVEKDQRVLDRAKEKLRAAIEFDPVGVDQNAFHAQLLLEARMRLDEARDILISRGEVHDEVSLAIAWCARLVPGGERHARACASDVLEKYLELAKQLHQRIDKGLKNVRDTEERLATDPSAERRYQVGTRKALKSRIVRGEDLYWEVDEPVYSYRREDISNELRQDISRQCSENEKFAQELAQVQRVLDFFDVVRSE